VREDTATSGLISINLDSANRDKNTLPQQGENIQRLPGNTQLAKVAPGDPIDVYASVGTLVGYNDQYNGLLIDNKGAAAIRFGEGEATLDAFGGLRVSNSSVQGDYFFPQGVNTRLFSINAQGSATITHDANLRAVVLTNTGATGDLIQYTSDQYHHYIPGFGQTTLMTVAAGDTGKANLTRNWGYFNDDNGMMFRESNGLSAVVRSSVTGTVQETIVDQSNWNKDTFDGTSGIDNPSGVALDVTKDNIYWFDMQWLGAGRIRFGVYIAGERVIAHEYYHSNLYPYPNMQTGSLPIRIEQRNDGATGATSQLKLWCCGVLTEGNVDISQLGTNFSVEAAGITSGTTETLIGGTRPIAVHPSGDINHNLYFPKDIFVGAWDSTAGAAAFVKIGVYGGGEIAGGSWDQKPGTLFESNTTGTVGTPGLKIAEYFVNATQIIDTSSRFSNSQNAIKNKADGTQPLFYFTATKLVGTNDVSTQLSITFKDVPN
jgi:hypothetical protein